MPYNNVLPFPLGTTADTVDSGLVGKTFQTTKGTVRLCQTATPLTAPAKKAALYTVSGDAAKYTKTTISSGVSDENVAGIVDPDLSGNVSANGYFWVYCGKGDEVTAIGAGAIGAGLLVGTTSTGGGGRVASLGAASSAATVGDMLGAIGVTIGAFTAAGDEQTIRLLGPC